MEIRQSMQRAATIVARPHPGVWHLSIPASGRNSSPRAYSAFFTQMPQAFFFTTGRMPGSSPRAPASLLNLSPASYACSSLPPFLPTAGILHHAHSAFFTQMPQAFFFTTGRMPGSSPRAPASLLNLSPASYACSSLALAVKNALTGVVKNRLRPMAKTRLRLG